ncbi:organic hydroperoxide resistance protein [Plastoroseomonas hellenica]|uniref:organic hydroperoxide resistance protein n=1 Tax=Plastoroseomonas hellenica TaxID=2687306 RepID=UPI001BAB9F31|nr:organic hydroperoxide resistance protein [Plastoroseomonas hellenica]MBR0646916.1 organic hydroperoxide resistance protein [Plastoroseomonas hellenica]
MNQPSKLLYTAKVHTTGGREGGTSRSSDGNLDIRISPPGGHGDGTNPEQLFAAGWSACFESAIGIAARRRKVALPSGFAIDAEVDLSLVLGFYTLGARLNVSLPGLPREVAQALVDEAHTLCPYSRATHGNIDVTTTVVV